MRLTHLPSRNFFPLTLHRACRFRLRCGMRALQVRPNFNWCKGMHPSPDTWSDYSIAGESVKLTIPIGNPLIPSPGFPPVRTVHAAFTAHGAPPGVPARLVAIAPPPITGRIHTATTAFQYPYGCLSFFDSLRGKNLPLNTFPCSTTPICTYLPLGPHSGPACHNPFEGRDVHKPNSY